MRWKFLLTLAAKDSRKNIGKLILFMSSIIAGIAALVSINSFNTSLTDDINLQAASLLGADIAATSNKAIEPSTIAFLDSLPGEVATEMELLSMSYMPGKDQSQIIRLKGVKGDFPFYGKINTNPASAAKNYQTDNSLLVDQTMMLQYGLQLGDSIKLGSETFVISGRLLSTFGSSSIASSFAPTIYINEASVVKSGLVQPGSLVNYARYYKVPKGFDADAWKEKNRNKLRGGGVRAETIDDRKENLREAFGNLNYFLNLVALVSLLLGCIGVASSVFIYVKSKVNSIAILRCLGVKTNEAFFIYFIQIFVLGLIAVILGAILGSTIQVVLPKLLKEFLPMQINLQVSWDAIFNGIAIGIIITTLFALLPLLEIRNISPLRTIRSVVDDESKEGSGSKLRYLLYLAIVGVIFLFLYKMTGSWKESAIFSIGLLLTFLILLGVSQLIINVLRKIKPSGLSFPLRQGISNLYRPNNQTTTLVLSLGLGTAILSTLYLIQGLLLGNVQKMDSGDQANTILYGIESNQIKAIEDTTKMVFNQPVIQSVPIVTMKLEAWKGKSKEEWLKDSTQRRNRWAMNREARVTYRDTIATGEQLIKGSMDRPVAKLGDSIYVSLGDSYAEALSVKMGDQLIFNVQGVNMTTYVGSLRKIEFNNMSTRFFIIFPTGVLEKAPQFSVLVTKTKDAEATAKYRSSIVKSFPNVSVVDLASILKSLNEILNKVSAVIKFMAIFSLITGIIVLISSLLLSKFQRMNESVLLRTLGAKKNIIYKINFFEYLSVGLLSSIIGVMFSLAATFFIAKYQFQLDFSLEWTPILMIIGFITGITLIIGLFNTREIVNKPPLEILRREA
jgi:putative ABC transport system permease protein